MRGEPVADELRAFAHHLASFDEDVPSDVIAAMLRIADRIDVKAEDEVAYALAQAMNDFDEQCEIAAAYAYDVGFDDGWQAGVDEPPRPSDWEEE